MSQANWICDRLKEAFPEGRGHQVTEVGSPNGPYVVLDVMLPCERGDDFAREEDGLWWQWRSASLVIAEAAFLRDCVAACLLAMKECPARGADEPVIVLARETS